MTLASRPFIEEYNVGITTRKTTEQFITEAVAVHGDKYSYEMVDYKSSHLKVQIWCNKHKEYFWQRPAAHTSLGCGCQKCGAEERAKRSFERQISFEQFVQRSEEIYGNNYSYYKDKYTSYTQDTEIYCKKHSVVFYKTPTSHVQRKAGCPLCIIERRPLTTEEFIQRAEAKHGKGVYDYSMVEYVDSNTHVKILCNEHGEFLQLPRSHMYLGAGCRYCAGTGFDKSKLGKVYFLASDDMFKVGITNRDVDLRVYEINRDSPQKFSTVFYKEMQGEDAYKVETLLLRWIKDANTSHPSEKFDGYTECFYKGKITTCDVINKLEEFEKQVQLI